MRVMVQEWVYWAATGLISMIVLLLLILEPIIDAYHRRKMDRESAERTYKDRL